MIFLSILLIAILTFKTAAVNSIFKIYKHPLETGARCLDGSEAAIYLEEGVGINQTKFMILLEGGGSCYGTDISSTLNNCYERSLTEYGSSAKYPNTLNMENVSALSAVKSLNPNFHDWTRVFVPYCDGSFHQGSRLNPAVFKGAELYFRGHNNTITHFNYLSQVHGMSNAETVVLSGVSAGAMATYYWANYLQDFVNGKVFIIPDSGIFVNSFVNPFTNKTSPNLLESLFQLVNTEINMPMKQCIDHYPSQRECFQAGVLAPFLKVPVFLVESLYDMYELRYILGYTCVPDVEGASLLECNIKTRKAIEEYKQATLLAIGNFTQSLVNVGVWAISCVQHGFMYDDSFNSPFYEVPHESKNTASHAVAHWLQFPADKTNNIHIDRVQWPYNIACCGVV